MADQELQVVEEQKQMMTLGNERPGDVISRAVEIADVLKPIITQKGLFKKIGDKDHVMAEGWAVLMGLINVDPVVDYARRIDRDGEIAYEARVSLVHHGRVVSAAETIASDREKGSWARSEQGIKSMAQTRAFGKACRLKYSWIMVMAGYAPTPAEEMPEDRPSVQMPRAKSESPVSYPKTQAVEAEVSPSMPSTKGLRTISDKQRKFIWANCRAANIPEEVFKAFIKETFLVEHTAELPWNSVDKILEWIAAYKKTNV